MDFHTKNIDDTFSTLETDTSGLSSDEVLAREEKYGLKTD